jgi:hypothetical protein
MKMFLLVRPDYEGDNVLGVFSSREMAEIGLAKGYHDPSSYQIIKYQVDPVFYNKFKPYFEHEISSIKDYGVRVVKRNWDHSEEPPNEHVWNSPDYGLQARGIGATPEEATNRAKQLLSEHAGVPVSVYPDYMPKVTNPRPDVISREV